MVGASSNDMFADMSSLSKNGETIERIFTGKHISKLDIFLLISA